MLQGGLWGGKGWGGGCWVLWGSIPVAAEGLWGVRGVQGITLDGGDGLERGWRGRPCWWGGCVGLVHQCGG